MKTTTTQPQNTGSVLMVTLVITGILGLTLASYLTLIGTQNRSVVRSQTWNASVPISEAGVEEAITHLNHNCLWSDITSKPVDWNADGWLTVANGYQRTRWLGDCKYVVTIVTADPHSEMRPAILSEGYVPAPFVQSMSKTMFAAIGTDETDEPVLVGRKVRVTTSRAGVMTGAMIAKDYIDFNGKGIETDSYDSENPAYSTDGLYDPLKRKDNGDVAVNFGLINTLEVGNASIYGSVAVGPGGSLSIGANGAVGTKEWHASNTGIQPGRSRDDMNVSFPDVEVPFTGGSSVPTPGTLTNEVITTLSVTNTSVSYPSSSGDIYTNTTTTTTTSYPVSGTYIGSVNTNTVYTTTSSKPSDNTYVGIVVTNTVAVTSSGYPTSGTYIGNVITNAPRTTTSHHPASGTYLGTVTTNWAGASENIKDYTSYLIQSYTSEQIKSYSYHKIASYTVARITSYDLVQSTYETNYVAVSYDYVLDELSDKYQIDSISGKVIVLGDAILYVTGSWNVSEIEIAQGARVKIYMAGSSFDVSGTKFINKSGDPDRLWYFGLPSNTSITVNGNGGFCGVIYAPQAHFQLNGGGSETTWDFIGASLTKSVKMNGHFHFHYDEALARKGASRGYIIDSWDEVRLDETH